MVGDVGWCSLMLGKLLCRRADQKVLSLQKPTSPTLHLQFQEIQLHSLKVASLDFYTSLHPHPPHLKAFSVLWSRYCPHLWMHSFNKVLYPWKRLPGRGRFEFWKEPEIARSQVGWVLWLFHQTDTIVIKVRQCDASFVRSCIVVMQLDLRPRSSSCCWLNMQKIFWQNWSCVICGSDCSFVGHYVDNNRPLSIGEYGEHPLSWTETCF